MVYLDKECSGKLSLTRIELLKILIKAKYPDDLWINTRNETKPDFNDLSPGLFILK